SASSLTAPPPTQISTLSLHDALPISVINPLWDQFKTLLPAVNDHHPLGCHRPRVADRIIFDKLVTRLVLGGAYTKHADDRVSATTLRTRRDEWIAHDVFFRLEQIVLDAFDQVIGLDLTHLSVDGCCVKAPCGGDNTGPNPTDRGKSGQKRSVLVEGHGLPIGVVLAGANRHDSPLLRPTLECLSRFGFFLPEAIDRKSTRLNSSHVSISYAVVCRKQNKLGVRTPARVRARSVVS